MKVILEAIIVLIKEGRKLNQAILIALLIVFAASMFGTLKLSFYKTQIEKIPCLETKVNELEKVVLFIPEMKEDLKWLARNRPNRRERNGN